MKRNFRIKLLSAILFAGSIACKPASDLPAKSPPQNPEEEVFYLIMPRSFRDSNGDRIGDLKGVTEKLDYIQSLGVTSIIMTPLSPSMYYHNYFADDFEGIDPEYGTLQDYLNFITEVHKRGMKFYMDTEWQYVTENQKWFKQSYHHPESRYTKYLFYHDSLNQDPEPILYNMRRLPSYNGDSLLCTVINLENEEVRKYMADLYAYWMDPNHDGRFDDGVDGFRIDHMMDDLDNKGILTHLFSEYWLPLFNQLKTINPKIRIIAEQADWGDPGIKYFTQAGVDIVYAFGMTFWLGDKEKFEHVSDTLLQITPVNKYQLIFLDNHDLDRYASRVGSDQYEMRKAASMLYLSKGIPYIYYGQELGMKGAAIIHGKDDGNDILRREAFEWTKDMNGKGMALWYKDSGPWWDSTYLRSNDGLSVEEEEKDMNSLLNFYRQLIHLRLSHTGLTLGEEKVVQNDNPQVLTYCRWKEDSRFLLAFSFYDAPTTLRVPRSNLPFTSLPGKENTIWSDKDSKVIQSGEYIELALGRKGFLVLQLE
jgi:alpha-amylase